MKTDTCDFCRANFRPGVIKDGKCAPCAEKYPGATSMKEWKDMNLQPSEDQEAFKAKVRKIVGEMLDEFHILSDCECGEKFFKNHPARKTCKKCKEAE